MAKWSLDLSKYADSTVKKTDQAFRKIASEIGRRIILRTPVDTGRARGNWFPGVGRPHAGATDAGDKNGADAIARIVSTAQSWRPVSGSFFISNNLPYIEVLERGRIGNKGSTQAPRGMVAITVAEFDNIVAGSVK